MHGDTTADGPTRELLRVRPDRIVRQLSRAGVGLNLNYLFDHDANRPPGSRTLAEAIDELGVTHLRYPGGEKSDATLWSTPPFEEPRPTPARTGPDEWPHGDRRLFDEAGRYVHTPMDFGQFLALCQATGTEPVVVVALDAAFKPAEPPNTSADYATLRAAAVAQVRFAAGRVRWWELGNESYLLHYAGQASAWQYAAAAADFAGAMKAVDPDIRVGLNGWEFADKPGRLDEQQGRTVPWWAPVIAEAGAAADFFALHDYPGWGWASFEDFASADRAQRFGRIGRVGGEIAAAHASTSEAAGRLAGLPVLVTEMNIVNWQAELQGRGWAARNDLGHAVALAEALGHMLAEPAVQTAMVWCTRWLPKDDAAEVAGRYPFDVLDEVNGLTPLGQAVAAWGRLPRGPERVLVEVEAPADLPAFAVFAGEPAENHAWGLLVVNKGNHPRPVTLDLPGPSGQNLTVDALTGTGPEDAAPAWRALDPYRPVLPPVSVAVVRPGEPR